MKNQSKNHRDKERVLGSTTPAWYPLREEKDGEDGEGRRSSHQETRAGTNGVL